GALSAHADMFRRVDATHSTFAQQLEDLIPLRNHLPDQWITARNRPERTAVIGTETLVGPEFGAALGTSLRLVHEGSERSVARAGLAPLGDDRARRPLGKSIVTAA